MKTSSVALLVCAAILIAMGCITGCLNEPKPDAQQSMVKGSNDKAFPSLTGETTCPSQSSPSKVSQAPHAIQSCSKKVGILGFYFQGEMAAFLTANGHVVTLETAATIAGGALDSLDVLYINRSGVADATAQAAAVESFVRSGGILITEFLATDLLFDGTFDFFPPAVLDLSFAVPSGTVCGGNTVVVSNPSNAVVTGLPPSWGCSGDPIGVFNVYNAGTLPAGLDIAVTIDVDQNGDGVNDPVVGTSCVDRGAVVACFTDFGDFTPLEFPRVCPALCFRTVEDEMLMANAVCLATDNCSVEVAVDIHPTSCPNPLSTKRQGVIPVAILGTAGFDVTQIDPSTVKLEGVPALRWAYEDVSTPFLGEPCGCTNEGPDGFVDLTLKFSAPEIIAAIGPDPSGNVVLTISGMTNDGRPIHGVDCMVIRPNNPVGSPSNNY